MEPLTLLLVYFLACTTCMVTIGYRLLCLNKKGLAWTMSVLGILLVYRFFLGEHPILRMLSLIATTFTAMKIVVTMKSYEGKPFPLSFAQWAAFAMGWAGMRAQPFETLGSRALPDAWPKIRFGLTSLTAGFAMLFLAHQVAAFDFNSDLHFLVVTALLLIAFSLILHFGLLSIAGGWWRLLGVRTYLLFKEPLKSSSLNEFWSQRWNLAFIEMTSLLIFRPFRKRGNKTTALMLAFAFSGLLHELAISVPVNGGYGLPLLYFIIQGAAIKLEQAPLVRNSGLLENKLLARLWVLGWLTAPIPLLFHGRFIREIIWPLAGF